MMNTRRVPFNNSLPIAKAAWLDAYCKQHKIKPSDFFEEAVDELMAKEEGGKRNGAHKDPQAKRA